MSIFTIIILLLVLLLFFRCQGGACTAENIFGIIMELLTKMGFLLVDVGTYAVQRFREIDWGVSQKVDRA